MDKYTFGNSQAAVNLTANILEQPQYIRYAPRVARLLSKQFDVFANIIEIPNKTIREATLLLWHERFRGLVEDLPEVVKTHILCVEVGKFRQVLSNAKTQE